MNIGLICLGAFALLLLRTTGFGGNGLTTSKEEDHKFAKQLERLENATVKTIRTHHGDVYDCVDFYKQPAFNHPLLKNQTINFQKKETRSHEKARNKVSFVETPILGLNDGGCPSGTVPIRRVTKADLMRAKLASESGYATNDKPATTHYARCRAPGDNLLGVAATLVIYNQSVSSGQYSAAKMRLQIGPDSIEAGWRADPQLYGDSQTRLYVRTDIRDSHCFNALCPGFVVQNTGLPIDLLLRGSRPGNITGIHISITSEPGRWVLRAGTGNNILGYWPDTLFVAPGIANYAEWGGEVFGAENVINPGMGSGEIFKDLSTDKDAFFASVQVIIKDNNQNQFVDPANLDCETDAKVYGIKDKGNVGDDIQYMIIYGGIRCYFCD